MSLGFVMILFAAVYESSANMSHQDGSNYFSSLYMYPKPATLPILPYYEVEIPEQEGKFFGGAAATRYETIIVRHTVRPVCLLVDGNVPSCDQVHNNYHPMPENGRRPPTVGDYESYFVDPNKPDETIEITEIPFRGAFLSMDTTVERDDEHMMAVDHETPSLESVLSATTDAQSTIGNQRQLLQTVLGAAGLTGAVTNIVGAGNAAVNAVGLAGAAANLGGAVAGLGGSIVTGAGGSGRPQATVYVTRVERVVDDRVTATLVPKNCVPDSGQMGALRPCMVNPYAVIAAIQQHTQPPVQPRPQPPVRSMDIVSQVDVLVKEFVGQQ